jgi:hypothetical protein
MMSLYGGLCYRERQAPPTSLSVSTLRWQCGHEAVEFSRRLDMRQRPEATRL